MTSASFLASAHQYLSRSTAPVTAPPFTLACWAVPTFAGNSGGNQGAISIANSSTGFSQWTLGVDGTPEWWIRRDEATSNLDELDVSVGVVANTRQFAMARIISATNVQLHILNADGSISSGQSTLSRNPTGINSLVYGSPGDGTEINNSSFDGLLGECWVANIDVMGPGGGAVDVALFRRLAQDGPWAIPRIASAIVDYRPFNQNFSAGQENFVSSGSQVLTPGNGGPSVGRDLQMLAGYQRFNDVRLIGML